MPYTLSMGLLWFAAAFAVGLVTGILVRSVVARRQIAAARASAPAAPSEPPVVPVTSVAPAPPEPADDEHGSGRVTTNGTVTAAGTDTGTAARAPAAPNVPDAEAVLGRPVGRDDLTVIEGLGPQVAELCHGIGIVTWRDLADTEVSLLRTMLDDAGGRYQVHDPTTWPAQAQLLADGRWVEFRNTVVAIRAGSSGST